MLAMHSFPGDQDIDATVRLADLDDTAPTRDVIAWDWRAGTATRLGPNDEIGGVLSREGWSYHVLAPVLPTGLAVVGDVERFVPAGDARIEVAATDTGARVVVKGAGEAVTLTGWADAAPTVDGAATSFDPATGIWEAAVQVPSRGWAAVEVVAAV